MSLEYLVIGDVWLHFQFGFNWLRLDVKVTFRSDLSKMQMAPPLRQKKADNPPGLQASTRSREHMGTDAAARWQNATVLIRNEWGKLGTGFFVLDTVQPGPPTLVRILVVTNKHVIHPDPEMRREAEKVDLSLVRRTPEGIHVPMQGTLLLDYVDDGPLWREHPQADVDVLAMDVTGWINTVPGWVDSLVPPNALCPAEEWAKCDINAGQSILVVGYPAGIQEAKTNRPLVRHGVISSDPQSTFTVVDKTRDPPATRTIRGFIVDCHGMRGSSGSPVILDSPPTGVPRIVASTSGRVSPPPYAVGIVSEGWVTELPDVVTLAYNAETIRETIAQFREHPPVPAKSI